MNLTHERTQTAHIFPKSEHFFAKSGHLFSVFNKVQGRPPLTSLVARLSQYYYYRNRCFKNVKTQNRFNQNTCLLLLSTSLKGLQTYFHVTVKNYILLQHRNDLNVDSASITENIKVFTTNP